jgi:DNA-binding NarL/FixJ family response regulator
LRRLLEDEPDVAVVGQASSVDDELALAAAYSPHIIRTNDGI